MRKPYGLKELDSCPVDAIYKSNQKKTIVVSYWNFFLVDVSMMLQCFISVLHTFLNRFSGTLAKSLRSIPGMLEGLQGHGSSLVLLEVGERDHVNVSCIKAKIQNPISNQSYVSVFRFQNRHGDADLIALLSNTAPPPDLNKVSMFANHVAKFQQEVGY